MNQGDLKGALADFTRVIELNPNFSSAYFSRSMVYTRMGDAQRATADLMRMNQLMPAPAKVP
jgi:Flp pilus assembly protein TadD